MTPGACRWSRRCSGIGAADGRLVVKATKGAFTVVVVGPRLADKYRVARSRTSVVNGPLTQRSLDEGLGLAIRSACIWPGAVVLDVHGLTSLTELSGAAAGAVVGEQSAYPDAVDSEEAK